MATPSCAPASFDLPKLDTEGPGPTLPFQGVVPCLHPTPKEVAFDEPTAVGVSAEEAFADIAGECSAPFRWKQDPDAADGSTQMSVHVELDRRSAVEVTYPASDLCANKLEIQADIVLATADGKLSVRGRSTFQYTPSSSSTLGPRESPAELFVTADALGSARLATSTKDRYVIRVGGAGSACAGEIRPNGDVSAAGEPPLGAWSVNGCPLSEAPVDVDSSPQAALSVEQLAKAWRDAHLDAAWESGDRTQLALDVKAADAPLCQNYYRIVTAPVDVRYGTADNVIPPHDVLGQISFDLARDDASIQLRVDESNIDCAMATPPPGYCENLSTASLHLEISYPNLPGQRLGSIVVQGRLRGRNEAAKTQQVLEFAGTPHAVDCLIEPDCPVDQICVEGFCRERAKR